MRITDRPENGSCSEPLSRRRALVRLAAGLGALAMPPLTLGAGAGQAGKQTPRILRLAMVGGAHIHAPDFAQRMAQAPEVVTRYVWDANPATAAARCGVTGGRVVEDPATVFRDPEVDAVVIASETFRHLELVRLAAQAGKHVFVEKPVGMNGAEAAAIAAAVTDAGLIFQTGYFMRSRGTNRLIRTLIQDGTLGAVTRLRLSNSHAAAIAGWFDEEWRWMADVKQAGVGAFGDMGCHVLDLLLWFMAGDRPLACSGRVGTALGRYPDCDEYGEALLRFASGAVATIAAGWVDHANPNQIEISGTKGHLRVTGGELFMAIPARQTDPTRPWQDLPEDAGHPLELFFAAVAGTEDLPLIPVHEAAEVNRVMGAIYQAHRDQAWVSL